MIMAGGLNLKTRCAGEYIFFVCIILFAHPLNRLTCRLQGCQGCAPSTILHEQVFNIQLKVKSGAFFVVPGAVDLLSFLGFTVECSQPKVLLHIVAQKIQRDEA